MAAINDANMNSTFAENQKGPASSHLGDAFKDIDFNPEFSYFKETKKPATNLAWKKLSFSVGEKEILKNVSGHVNGGEVCALMGPSGAGKSSLLNVLAGRILADRKKSVAGVVTINDEKIIPSVYRKNIAYVLQEDSLYATATAKESLEFSARLRLPAQTSKEARDKIVNDLLVSLGLDHVKDTMVGSELIKGLSGGEKKRVAIGVELVTNPNLLFLDEPTSGLDSFSAWKVVKILETLSKATGCAILCTIHQPSSEIFNSFHKTMILSKGSVMYNGSVTAISQVFDELGFPIPALTNPADYVMLIAQTAAALPHYNPDEDEKDEINVQQLTDDGGSDIIDQRKAGFCTQASVLAVREFRNFYRDIGFLVANIAITLFLNLLFGAVFYQAANRDEPDYTVAGGYGALLLVLTSAMFGSAQGPLLTFPLERSVMIREYQTGTYSSFPYLLSKLLVELPRSFIVSLIVMLASYWLIGYNGNFFLFVLVIFGIQVCSASYAYVLGAAVADAKQGQEFAPLVLVPQLLFTGLFVPIAVIPEWLQWVQYVCVLKYGVNLGALVEFGDCQDFDTPAEIGQCETIFELNDISSANIGRDIGILVAIFITFRCLSLAILIYRARHYST
uniref:ABC transporter domain-containing protein n=1 Tax=Aplanochytrium stocchinoi TaxID=215587 RepID=A0A7S3LMG6_9STRA|mmetsp:Transcript_27403/g.33471  ORF Transcript_27403/g.33471 Transcript_27403/m.33471 type:complete len:620 (+) Transcript_27403:271-2130(+)